MTTIFRSAAAQAILFGVLAIALAISAGLAGASFASSEEARKPAGGPLAAVFPPWIDADDAAARVYRAGGLAMGERRAGVLIFAAGHGARFEDALLAEGAWLVFDGDAAAAWIGDPV